MVSSSANRKVLLLTFVASAGGKGHEVAVFGRVVLEAVTEPLLGSEAIFLPQRGHLGITIPVDLRV
jgi:hypothetical protein